jgi:O-Antigen ligase
MNEYNYIRAETLSVPSIEFFALVFAFIFFLFFTEKKLIELYIILLPFTDKVYRFLSLQPSDILSIIIILSNLKYISKNLRYLYLIIPLFLFGSLNGLIQFDDSYGIQYSIRILLIFGAVNVISSSLVNGEKDISSYINLYKKVVWFSLAVAFSQVFFWYLNFPVAGIFYGYGIPRMKGLSHEPSTFCFWLAMSLPFGIQHKSNIEEQGKTTFDRPYIVALLITIIYTGSTSGLITTIVLFLLFLLSELKKNLSAVAKYLASAVLIVMIIGASNTSLATYFGEYVTAKLGSYISEMVSGESKGEESGRGGDRKLFKYLSENPLFGIGAFRSSQLSEPSDSEEYIPGSNFYITIPTEFGVVGTLGLMWIFASWWKLLYVLRCPSNTFIGFGLIAWIVSLVGMRTFGFHQPWLVMCMYVTTSLIHSGTVKPEKATNRSLNNSSSH